MSIVVFFWMTKWIRISVFFLNVYIKWHLSLNGWICGTMQITAVSQIQYLIRDFLSVWMFFFPFSLWVLQFPQMPKTCYRWTGFCTLLLSMSGYVIVCAWFTSTIYSCVTLILLFHQDSRWADLDIFLPSTQFFTCWQPQKKQESRKCKEGTRKTG